MYMCLCVCVSVCLCVYETWLRYCNTMMKERIHNLKNNGIHLHRPISQGMSS